MRISWYFAQGSDYSSGTAQADDGDGLEWQEASDRARNTVGQVNCFDSTSNDIFITGLQFEVGDTATSFEHRSHGEELARCQRYYQTAPADTLMVYKNNTASWLFPVAMRVAPTMAFIGLSGSGAALAATANGFRQSASNSQSSGFGYTASSEL